ncbi:endoribonuclease [Hoeflea sp. BAL378]|uniref:Rid family hydrolase n=1 Tax=Hoeflea sp. BAL378 TaxID=1547437 RepID=UPI0005135981|nr:Rid family hydrolase [Hoeflea sp. BAL378]KGF69420.1 endoribonuclease [Hoeflea sp. BAL378]
MTDIVKVKTGNKYEELGSYSRLVAIDNLILVSNTAGRNPKTKLISEDLAEQTLQALSNIEGALAAVGATLADVVRARVFVQFPQDIDTIMAAYGEKMRGINPALTMTCPPLGSTDYKVEIEVTAYRGSSKANVTEMTISL